jgi:hypothetical protein
METLTIAFLPPVIKGHANVHLATITRLLAMGLDDSPRLHIHVLADAPLRKEVEALPRSSLHSLTFHTLGEQDHILTYTEDGTETMRQPPPSLLRADGLRFFRLLASIISPSPEIYLQHYGKILNILEEIKPDFAVADVLYNSGVDACIKAGIKYAVMTPFCSLDLARWIQPLGRGLWKYPM